MGWYALAAPILITVNKLNRKDAVQSRASLYEALKETGLASMSLIDMKLVFPMERIKMHLDGKIAAEEIALTYEER